MSCFSVFESVRKLGKIKPFIAFKGAKQEVGSSNKEFHGKCIISSSANYGWIPSWLTNRVENVPDSFSFSRQLLAWDTYQCHLEDSVSNSLKIKLIRSWYREVAHAISRHPMYLGTSPLNNIVLSFMKSGCPP